MYIIWKCGDNLYICDLPFLLWRSMGVNEAKSNNLSYNINKLDQCYFWAKIMYGTKTFRDNFATNTIWSYYAHMSSYKNGFSVCYPMTQIINLGYDW